MFNAAPLGYREERRRSGAGRNYQALFGLAQITDAESGEALTGWRVWLFEHGAARYYGLAPDLGISQDVLGAIGVAAGEQGAQARIRLSCAGHIYEARSGRYLGEGDTLSDNLTATSAQLYCVMPYRVQGMDLTCDGGRYHASLQVAKVEAGEHVFRFDYVVDLSRFLPSCSAVLSRGHDARPTWNY